MASRSELLGLLAAVKEAPEDDTPRLVLADWLEDHGDTSERARGELIRVQCEFWRRLAQALDASCAETLRRVLLSDFHGGRLLYKFATFAMADPEMRRLWLRGSAVIQEFGAGWMERWPKQSKPRWLRGMSTMRMSLKALHSQGFSAPVMSESWAWLERLHLSSPRANLRHRFNRSPAFQVAALDLSQSSFGAEELESLLCSSMFHGLRRLNIGGCGGGTRTNPVLAKVPFQLTHFYSPSTYLHYYTPEFIEAPCLSSLVSLSLRGLRFGPDCMATLGQSAFLGQLTDLDLTGTRIQPAGLAALTGSRHYRTPTMLELQSCSLGAEGLSVLLDSPGLENVRVLNLAYNNVSESDLAVLAQSPRLANLVALDLSHNPGISNGDAFPVLFQSPHLQRLVSLSVVGTRISETRLCELVRSAALPRLAHLEAPGRSSAGPAFRQAWRERRQRMRHTVAATASGRASAGW